MRYVYTFFFMRVTCVCVLMCACVRAFTRVNYSSDEMCVFLYGYTRTGRHGEREYSRVGYSQIFDESEIEFLGKTRGTTRQFSSPCSSEIQVDGVVDLTGTARLYRDNQGPRKWGQVQRGVPSNSIAFKVAALFYPSVLKAPGLSEKERRCLIPLNFLLFLPASPVPHDVFSLRFSRNSCAVTRN